MARHAVKLEPADVGREDLVVALLAQLVRDECLQLLAHDRAGGRPEDQSLADHVVDHEELEVLAELAVVAELGLLELVEVGVELGRGGEGRAVDALELFVVLVAAVVGARDGQQFEGLDLLRVLHVGAGAQVDELTVLVEGDGLALGNVGKTAELVAFLADLLDDADGFVATDLFAREGLVLGDDLLHFGLDLREVLGGQLVVEVDVVIEAGLRRRADVELRVRKDAKDGRGEHVRAGVTEFFEGSHHGSSE